MKKQPLKLPIIDALKMPISFVFALILAITLVFEVLDEPWLGLRLHANKTTDKVEILNIHKNGPAQHLPFIGQLEQISGVVKGSVSLVARDKMNEPDVMDSYQEIEDFYIRQSLIHDILTGPEVTVRVLSISGEIFTGQVSPTKRPIYDLPMIFWMQLLVSVGSLFVGIWVFLVKQNLPSIFFGLAGVGLSLSAGTGAIYSSRELALDGILFDQLSTANHFGGTFLFAACLVALFFIFPLKLASRKWLLIYFIFGLSWQVVDFLALADDTFFGNHLWIAIQMAIVVFLISTQYIKTAGKPRDRAIIMWFGISVIVSARIFVLINIIPVVFGIEVESSVHYVYLVFWIIYIGFGLGVARYKLFELDSWAFRVMFYLGGVAIIIDIGAIMVLIMSLNVFIGFGWAIFTVSVSYFPYRKAMFRRLMNRSEVNDPQIFNDIIDIAYADSNAQQNRGWLNLMQQLFRPLRSGFNEHNEPVATMVNDGLEILIPRVKTIPAIKLEYANEGRKLFSGHDVARAQELVAMIGHAIDNRYAHEKGVREERLRIARDMHDNIGAQLLSALHSKKTARKDVMIRETITDLRDIINNASSQELTFNDILADLRVETAERLATAEMDLKWVFNAENTPPLNTHTIHTLRSIIREVVSNAIKHSGAKTVYITWLWEDEMLKLFLRDDGCGIGEDNNSGRAGLANIESRVKGLEGEFIHLPNDPGASFEIQFAVKRSAE
ncbi:MAG: hypothetical protein COB13_004340 [OCS116 cluster bacterium]|nr:hypothetical protein [OCS116 cluster bacterium]